MGLVVSAQVIRELIADGEYIVESIEQREQGKVAVAFALRARAQPYNIQIETADNKLEGLFRALLTDKDARSEKSPLARLGGQAVPIVEVASLPADVPKRRRRQQAEGRIEDAQATAPGPASRRRSSGRQLILMPQDVSSKPNRTAAQSRRGRPLKVRERPESS
jgi:hypothetical protein